MAKLYFMYGAMNSSKTGNLIMLRHNYLMQNRKVICLKPSTDTRWQDSDITAEEGHKKGFIESRAFKNSKGEDADRVDCLLIEQDENLYDLIKTANNSVQRHFYMGFSAIFVDEAQFLTPKQVKQLADVVQDFNISVYCYGLKNSYVQGKLFEGSAALLYYAQETEEIMTICKFCNEKATHNLRVVDGCAVYDGASTSVVGDVAESNDYYVPVCYKHFKKPPAPIVLADTTKQDDNFSHALQYALTFSNDDGFYSKKKVPKNLFYEEAFAYFENKEAKIDKLRYFCIGSLMLDFETFSKKIKCSKRNNGIAMKAVILGIIRMLYDIFEFNPNGAFNILKSSQNKMQTMVFFETESDYLEDMQRKTGTSTNRYFKLPDGRYFYMDLHKNTCVDFLRVLCSVIAQTCHEKVGVIYELEDV